MKLALTAGYDRAPHAVALAELLSRRGHVVEPVFVVSPWNRARIRAFMKRGGVTGLVRQARRLAGWPAARSRRGSGGLAAFLRANTIEDRSLGAWARRRGSRVVRVSDLNAPRTVARLASAGVDGLVYAGGGILRGPLLDAVGGRVLNAHSGPLPEVRGMNACEWSLLLGLPPTVTIHFIDRGIDSGEIVGTLPVPVRPGDDVDALRERCARLGVEGILAHVGALGRAPPPATRRAATSRQCYILAPALREVLDLRLAVRTRG